MGIYIEAFLCGMIFLIEVMIMAFSTLVIMVLAQLISYRVFKFNLYKFLLYKLTH